MSDDQKTAVIVVHGMGEQRPMTTLWGFIEAAWIKNGDLVEHYNSTVYSKPGNTPDNHELRRVTTRGDKHDKRRFDFYEYYWAHMMLGNTLADIKGWLLALFFRPRGGVPTGYRGYWWAGWIITILAVAGWIVWAVFSGDTGWRWLTAAISLVFPLVTSWILSLLIPIVGDAARYLQPDPHNIEARQRIRAEGIALLKRLHESGEYDRIIMVGHSLGSLVAYDILTHAWAQIDAKDMEAQHTETAAVTAALDDLEKASIQMFEPPIGHTRPVPLPPDPLLDEKVLAFRNAQRAYRKALAHQDNPLWMVSDLVTLGSPLGKADILLAETEKMFTTRKVRREFPTAPPEYEYWGKDAQHFSYRRPERGPGKARIPHHGAPFAPTVWSNIYFPAQLLLLGDPVAGAVAPHFGPGVLDTRLPNNGLRFQHLDYWKEGDDPASQAAVAALRKALNLRDLDDR